MRKDWDRRREQIVKDKKREEEGEYKLPLHLKILSITTQIIILGLCLHFIANMFVDDTPVLNTYKADVVIDIHNGKDISVSDTLKLPQDSEGATGFVRFIPDFTLDERGEGGDTSITDISATLDGRPLKKLNPAEKVKGYLVFSQDDEENLYYGHELKFNYKIINAARTQNVARYATIQLLNKRLTINAKLIDVLIYFPQKVDSPSKVAELYVRSKEESEVKLVAKGQASTIGKNVVQIQLQNFDIKKKDLFLKLTWSDFRDLESQEN